jgi:hypothetical protein
MLRKKELENACGGVVLLFLSAAALLGLGPPFGVVLCAMLDVAGLVLLGRGLAPTIRRWFRDPYSLDALREVEQAERNRPVDIPKEELVTLYCPVCDEVYPGPVHTCPRCGRTT